MDLFSAAGESQRQQQAPLAERMRPRRLDDIVGQSDLIGPGTLLRRVIDADEVPSIIFHGPPGSGKTTLARVIAQETAAHFEPVNAVSSGVADLRRLISDARQRLGMQGRRTIVFIDEIHRFNRSQQDALLPAVEDGTVVLIGATTENPFFSVNRPLLSRCRLFELKGLQANAVRGLLEQALTDREKGLAKWNVGATDDALDYLASVSNGDVRIALNTLEFCVVAVAQQPGLSGNDAKVELTTVQQALQRRHVPFAKDDEHYDVTSAFIKSMRGSDPDATLYWLGRLIYAGEDVTFIARRIMVHAAEDVGLADPQALVVATAAAQAAERVGFPEARIILAQAALYIALAPKSNSVYKGIEAALQAVEKHALRPPPPSLRDAHYEGAAQLGHGVGYLYPHDYPGHWVDQQYLPDGMQTTRLYKPSGSGAEKHMWQRKPGRGE